MTTTDFLNKFYIDKEYKKSIKHNVLNKNSSYVIEELVNQKQAINHLYVDLLLSKISNEIYSSKNIKEIRIKN